MSADRLLDQIWGDDLPQTGARAVAFQISRLRDALSDRELIATSSAGYALRVERVSVDALHFEDLLVRARAELAAAPATAETLILQALALWRGPPFADLGDERFVDEQARQLRQRLLLARRTLAEARIALGRHVETIADLEALIVEHPFDEGLVELLMTALHRCGRTADGLRIFGELRLRLSDELGIEPSASVRQREQQLLSEADGGSPTDRSNGVPVPLSSFIGRADDVKTVMDTLFSARLVTLCGFGGLGKTRLALEVARRLDGGRDGVVFVDLTTVSEPTLVADAFLGADATAGGGGVDPADRLLAHLRNRAMTLVVDNCEHLVEPVATLVHSILRHAGDVRVLATSRVPLGIPGEVVVPVQPLTDETGVELFVERATLMRRTFAIDESNRKQVGRLCARLDGIPLAIEMAAGRLAVMSLDQLDRELDDQLRLLDGGRRRVDERQRSLRAVMEWSYGLLDDRSQALLRRLSLCTGGFSLEAARAIGVLPDEPPIDDVLDRLTVLVDTSLVVFAEAEGTPRFKLLDTVRAYVGEQLDLAGERTATSLAHAEHYASVAARIRAMVDTDAQAFIGLGNLEKGNLIAAINWANSNGHADLALRIVRDAWFWFTSARMHRLALRYIRTGVEQVKDPSLDAVEAAGLALIADSDADPEMLAFLDQAASLVLGALERVEDPTLRSTLLRGVAGHLITTQPRSALTHVRSAAAIVGASPLSRFVALHNLAGYSWVLSALEDSDEVLAQIDALVAEVPAYAQTAAAMKATIAALQGRWNEVLTLAERSGDDPDLLNRLEIAAAHIEALVALGRHDDAEAALRALAVDMAGEGDVLVVPFLWASLDLARGRPEAAVGALTARLDRDSTSSRGPVAWIARLTALLGAAAHQLDQPESAAVLFGQSAHLQRRFGVGLRPLDHVLVDAVVADCEAALGRTRFAELAERGAGLEVAQLPRIDVPLSR